MSLCKQETHVEITTATPAAGGGPSADQHQRKDMMKDMQKKQRRERRQLKTCFPIKKIISAKQKKLFNNNADELPVTTNSQTAFTTEWYATQPN